MIWLLVPWLALELAAQPGRWGFVKVWSARLPGGRGGVTLHPLLVLVASPSYELHERIHARQMARYTWIGFLVLYGLSGRWRARLEAEAYAKAARGPRGKRWVQRVAEGIRSRTYFRWWWPGRDPGQAYVETQLRRWT